MTFLVGQLSYAMYPARWPAQEMWQLIFNFLKHFPDPAVPPVLFTLCFVGEQTQSLSFPSTSSAPLLTPILLFRD